MNNTSQLDINKEVEKEVSSVEDRNIEMADKTSGIFYGTANVYLADFEVVQKIYYMLAAGVLLVAAIMFRSHIIMDMVIVTGLGLFFYMGQNKLIADLFKIAAQYNSTYRENANYLKRLLSQANKEETYNSISFNSKTVNVDKGVDKKAWNDLVGADLFSDKFNVSLQNVLDSMETIEAISDLKAERDKALNQKKEEKQS